jgi:nucleotide-binding universal stress UspA family protein
MNELAANPAQKTSRRFEPNTLPGVTVERPRVLLALFEQELPSASLLRAFDLSRALGADLYVVRVMPELSKVNFLFPEENLPDAIHTVERTLRANWSTRMWLRETLGDDESSVKRFVIAHGDFVEQVAVQAAELGVVLIVVPPRNARMGRQVTSLARASNVPVLVMLKAVQSESIVAATDLGSPDYPVLRKAAELCRQLDAPLVAIHNINPVSVLMMGIETAWQIPLPAEGSKHKADTDRLAALSAKLSVDARPVIRHDVTAVDAILGEAREQDAGLVVVGTRRRQWSDRFLARSIAAQVVNRARRSVLVTPLDGGFVPFAAAPL